MKSTATVVPIAIAWILLSPPAPGQEDPSPRADELTEERCREAATKLEESLRRNDPAVFREMWDLDATVDKAVAGLKIPKPDELEFRRGIRGRGEKDDRIFKLLPAGRVPKLLRIHEVDGKMRALFRFFPEAGGVTYADLVLAAGRERKVRIVDLYLFTAGELASDILRRTALELASHVNRGTVARLTGWQSDFIKNRSAIREMQASFTAGRWKEAYETFRKLPSGLQKEKFILLQGLAIAQRVGDPEYEVVMAEFMEAHPQDPAVALISIDAFLLKKKYEDALKAAEKLEAIVGGDPYLHSLRGDILLLGGKIEEAKRAAARCIALEPDLIAPYWVLVSAALKERDFKETARLLTLLEKNHSLKIPDLQGVEAYAEFVRSAEYAEWMKSRAKPGR